MSKRRFQITRTVSEPRSAEVRLVSILSGKGGVGKSVLAFNLAERLAEAGKRVLLVDLDVDCGNLHIMANQLSSYGLPQVVTGELTLAEAVTAVNNKLDLLVSVGGLPQGMTLSSGAAQLVRHLRGDGTGYDLILVDHPSGKSEASLVLAAASDVNILVVVPELTSIADACGLYKLLLTTDASLDCRLLINRTESDGEADYIHKKFGALTERFYGRPPGYLGRLLEDGAIRRAVAAQTPLVATDDGAVTLTELEKMAARLLSERDSTEINRLRNHQLTINNVPAAADIRE